MNTGRITVIVPKEYRFVTTRDAHCHEIASAYIKAEFRPETILVSKEGRKVSIYDVERHASDVFHAVFDVRFHKDGEWYCRMADGCDAMFGTNGTTVVATVDEKGNLVLLPYYEQKPTREFVVTDEHRKTFIKYQKRLKKYAKEEMK